MRETEGRRREESEESAGREREREGERERGKKGQNSFLAEGRIRWWIINIAIQSGDAYSSCMCKRFHLVIMVMVDLVQNDLVQVQWRGRGGGCRDEDEEGVFGTASCVEQKHASNLLVQTKKQQQHR